MPQKPSLRELQNESRTVFILGAGASSGIGRGQEPGVPLMRDFLDVAYELYRTHPNLEFAESFEVVFDALKELQGVYAKALIDLRNVEAAFAAFEMMELFEKEPESKIKTYPDHMRNLIITTVTETTRFSLKDAKLISQPPYEDFVRLIINKLVSQMKRKCAIITFNYDLAVDVALANWNIPFRYCIKPEENRNGIPLLKLHGSLNWKRCANDCPEIQIVDVPLTSIQPHCQIKSLWNPSYYTYRPFQAPNLTMHCNHGIKNVPVIVPPTWNKNKHYKEIEGVWQAAQQELRFAENIIVCGYSLPETDMFFRYLFALGTFGDVRLKRLLVCNPDGAAILEQRGKVEERFRSMLGRISEDRFEFKSNAEGYFDQSIVYINNIIENKKW